jgi:hypothetical protein
LTASEVGVEAAADIHLTEGDKHAPVEKIEEE